MKILEKIVLVLFSNIIIILSVLACLLIFGWLDIDLAYQVTKNILNNTIASNALLAVSIIFILLGIKCVFFDSQNKSEMRKDGILLENQDGKLLISKDTLENLVNTVVKGFDTAETVTTKVQIDKENNIIVYVNLLVSSNVIIKDLSTNLQIKVKETVKTATDLDIKEVNVQIKNIAPKKDINQDIKEG